MRQSCFLVLVAGLGTGCTAVGGPRSGFYDEAASAPSAEIAADSDPQAIFGGTFPFNLSRRAVARGDSTAANSPEKPDEGSGGEGSEGADAAPKGKRQIIYTANFTIQVPSGETAATKWISKVTEAGGYLEKQEGSLVRVRVPAIKFHELVETLPSYGRVLDKSVSAQDVTMRYFDLKLRIEVAETGLQRLREL
ncbi:MAG: DUF4349 domain-containing protein, partial [Planctomycetota bacterium]